MNRIIVITGGTSGIGKELVKIYEEQGDTVCVLSRGVEDGKENYFSCDVSNEEQVKFAIDTIGEKYKKIDILINCAGYGISGALELTPTIEAEKQFDVNMLGCFIVNKHAIKWLVKGSTIVHIASACSLFALPFRGLYCASKAAVYMYSNSLRMELNPLGINVLSICPGEIKTNFTKNRVKIFETNERYGDRIYNAAFNIDKNEDKRMPADKCAKKIYKISVKKNPKPMYIISGKFKLLYFAERFLPKRAMLYFTEKFFSGKKKKQ